MDHEYIHTITSLIDLAGVPENRSDSPTAHRWVSMGRTIFIICALVTAAGCTSRTEASVAAQPAQTEVTTAPATSTFRQLSDEPFSDSTTTTRGESEDNTAPDCRPEPFRFAPVDLSGVELLVPFGADDRVTRHAR